MCDFDKLTKSKEFVDWFWRKDGDLMNGAKLIKVLNSASTGTKKLRYEEHGPFIYAVKLKELKVEIEPTGKDKNLRLLKVGFTHMDTSQGNTDSRINQLMDEIKKKISKEWKVEVDCSVVFVLSINALDTRCFFDVEQYVRSQCGLVVPKRIGKALRLPVHTEWVVTTNNYIESLRKCIGGQKTPVKLQKKQLTQLGRSSEKSKPTPQKEKEATGARAAPVKSMTDTRKEPPNEGAARASGSKETDDLSTKMADISLEESMIDTKSVFEKMTEEYKIFATMHIDVSNSLKAIGEYNYEDIKVTLVERDEQGKPVHFLRVEYNKNR